MIRLIFGVKMILDSCRTYYQQHLILVSVRHQPYLLTLGHIFHFLCSLDYMPVDYESMAKRIT